MAEKFDAYHYLLIDVRTRRCVIHSRGFTSAESFLWYLDLWNHMMPGRWQYEPVHPIAPRGTAPDTCTVTAVPGWLAVQPVAAGEGAHGQA